MKAFWSWLHGFAHFASFVLPKAGQHYPYVFAEETLTRNWEAIGHDLKKAVAQYQQETTRDR